MSSRHSAARPKRDGESFARSHHGAKKTKFDVRNPSALAPDERDDDDEILDADVIGASGTAVRRGAVNIDGYDSDSDNENITTKANARQKSKQGGNILDQLENYDVKDGGRSAKGAKKEDNDDDDDDMFGGGGDDDDKDDEEAVEGDDGSRKKEVRFLDAKEIRGEELESRNKTEIRLDDADSDGGSDERDLPTREAKMDEPEESDDGEEREEAIQEEDVDEEVGLGGLKKNAPKIEAFNLKEEQEEGRFDENQNFVRKAADPNARHDRWLEGVSKKEMKKAAEAHERREAEARKQRMEDDEILATDLLSILLSHLEKGETALEALARLGKRQPKKIPKWKLKKMHKGSEAMDVDNGKEAEDPEQKRIKEAIDSITDAADKLLSRDFAEIYDQSREMILRMYKREAGTDWAAPAKKDDAPSQWEYRWTDGRGDGSMQGPFDGAAMKTWQDAGYFGEGVEFRRVGGETWQREVDFV